MLLNNLNNGSGPTQESQPDLAEAKRRINDLKLQVNSDPGVAHSLAYIDAAAIIYERDKHFYDGLRRNLKSKQVGITRWEHEVTARHRERQQEQAAAAQAAGGGQQTPIASARPAPWHQPVSLADLLDDLTSYVKRFVR